MNLFFQLLPLLLLSAIIGMAAVLYLMHASKMRQSRRHPKYQHLAAAPQEQHPPSASDSTPSSQITAPKQRSTANAPLLRLHDLEMTPVQIAAALEKPLQEVEITLKFEEVKRRRLAAS